MKIIVITAILSTISITAASSVSADERNGNLRRDYSRSNPPPVGCNPCILDHKVPLKAGGTNDPSNLGWQTPAEAKAKDKIECDGHRCGHP